MFAGLIDGRRREAIAVAAVLFIAIFVLRTTVGTLADAISFLYVIPVVIVAISLGTSGGVMAGAVAFALSTASALIADQPTSPLGYFNRAIVFLFIGALVGRFAATLRSLEAESTRFLELSRDMICVAGFDGYFKRVNPAFERTLGYSRRELLERPFVEFVHPDDRDDTDVETGEISDNGRATVHFQNRYIDKDGGVHWIEWTSVGVPEEERIYAVARDVTERKLLEQELELRSRSDPLTGMLNRRSFDESLVAQLAHARRYKRGGALLIADLDRFKQINDEFGHAAGDEALRMVSRVLAENLRETDTVGRDEGGLVARLGGDEFALLLPEADAAGAEAVGERLVAALAAEPLRLGDREVRLGVSIGIATFGGAEFTSAEELLAAADRAMYVVKAAGGGGASIESRS
ncbi:MAG TPA: diguanylate cyclase [Solirubrobacterales bacterium]|nr:diguanylate cyclase [Solirubrobacterales bacterium]